MIIRFSIDVVHIRKTRVIIVARDNIAVIIAVKNKILKIHISPS